MAFWRTLILDRRRLALLLVLCALFMKAWVPSGYMIGGASKTMTVEMCADGKGPALSRQISIPMKQGLPDPSGDHGKMDGQCAFSSLSMAGLTGADSIQLALALAFILVLGFAAATLPLPSRTAHLRPPLRGPPAAA